MLTVVPEENVSLEDETMRDQIFGGNDNTKRGNLE